MGIFMRGSKSVQPFSLYCEWKRNQKAANGRQAADSAFKQNSCSHLINEINICQRGSRFGLKYANSKVRSFLARVKGKGQQRKRRTGNGGRDLKQGVGQGRGYLVDGRESKWVNEKSQ